MMNFYLKGFYNEITIMKAIAAFLITWFHFKWTVPDMFSNIFVGGAIGNTIFFYCSGYLLKFNEEKFKGEWLIKKIIRLLPSVWIFMLFVCLFNFIRNQQLVYSIFNWIYPTTYWFINAILFFFLVIYILKVFFILDLNLNSSKCESILKNKFWLLIFITIILYVSNYFLFVKEHHKVVMDDGSVKCWFYFFIFFLYGYYAKLRKKVLVVKHWSQVVFFPCSIGLFYFYKKSAENFPILAELQFIIIPLCLFLVLYTSRYFAIWIYNLNLLKPIQKVLTCLSNITLDIYIVQVYLINWLMPEISFPINIIVLFIIIVIAAIINKNIADRIGKFILNHI